MNTAKLVNTTIAGLGGQGVIRCSDILAEVAFIAGYDVKKAEVHGMSQRGGSVSTDVRFGEKVWSPMIPVGQADFLIVISEDQVENNLACLKPGGKVIRPGSVDSSKLDNKKALNTALLGCLSRELDFSLEQWNLALSRYFSGKVLEDNMQAFVVGGASNV